MPYIIGRNDPVASGTVVLRDAYGKVEIEVLHDPALDFIANGTTNFVFRLGGFYFSIPRETPLEGCPNMSDRLAATVDLALLEGGVRCGNRESEES